jgi:hypothetical protein
MRTAANAKQLAERQAERARATCRHCHKSFQGYTRPPTVLHRRLPASYAPRLLRLCARYGAAGADLARRPSPQPRPRARRR